MGFKNILFPVDFSKRSDGAAAHVRAMAARHNAALTLMNVVETPAAWLAAGDGAYIADFDLPRMKEEAEGRLKDFAADKFAGQSPAIVVEDGDPGTRIAEVAEERGIDLVMMPTHGRGKFRVALLGSVTAKVLHDAHCAVWTGVHLEDAAPPEHLDLRTTMCALDLKEGSAELLRYTARLAKEAGAKVYIVHAVPGTEVRPDMYFDMPLENFLKDTARRQIDDLQAREGTNFPVCMEVGRAATVVREASLHHNADLVTIGRGVIGEFAGRLRTDAYAIMREAPCPVLSV